MSELSWLILGLVLGMAVAAPFVVVAARRAARRTQRLEQRARSAERLAELGTLTGGLAHEIKNPLSTIGLNLQLLSESIDEADLPDDEKGRLSRRIASISAEADRLRDILEDFLSFAGRVKLDRRSVDVNELLQELIDFYEPQAQASGIQLRTRLDPAVGQVEVDPTLLKQALLNLLINATQAMVAARYGDDGHGGATDLILTSESHPAEPAAAGAAAGDRVVIHVIDTGPGVPDAAREKIFHPYFSTKKGGSGLGLAVTRRIVEEHGGSISVHSDDGKGSDFAITLPRTAPESAATSND